MIKWIVFMTLVGSIVVAQPIIQNISNSSVNVYGGMGVQLIYAEKLTEYLNSMTLYSDKLESISASPQFFAGIEFPIGIEGWGFKFEYAYTIKSFTLQANFGGTVQYSYEMHAPNAMIQRIYYGTGYYVTIGIGGGYHIGSALEKRSIFGTEEESKTHGYGVLAELTGQTAFDDNFYGYLSGLIGWEKNSALTNAAGTSVQNNGYSPTLSYPFAGIRFGVLYRL